MARPLEGWKLKRKRGRKIWNVVFTHNGIPVERSTGCEDREQAKGPAGIIYADHVQREPARKIKAVRRTDSPPLEELVGTWLTEDTTIGETTVNTWTVYGGHWRARWETLIPITEASIVKYRNERLSQVIADTVRKELGALKRFLTWCQENGHLQREVVVCTVPPRATAPNSAVP